MTAWVILVAVLGTAPQQATPVAYASEAECKRQAAALRLTASSTTRYRCVPA